MNNVNARQNGIGRSASGNDHQEREHLRNISRKHKQREENEEDESGEYADEEDEKLTRRTKVSSLSLLSFHSRSSFSSCSLLLTSLSSQPTASRMPFASTSPPSSAPFFSRSHSVPHHTTPPSSSRPHPFSASAASPHTPLPSSPSSSSSVESHIIGLRSAYSDKMRTLEEEVAKLREEALAKEAERTELEERLHSLASHTQTSQGRRTVFYFSFSSLLPMESSSSFPNIFRFPLLQFSFLFSLFLLPDTFFSRASSKTLIRPIFSNRRDSTLFSTSEKTQERFTSSQNF
jgi:hypothetical protein